jgi:hypothetical protein
MAVWNETTGARHGMPGRRVVLNDLGDPLFDLRTAGQEIRRSVNQT